jgi:protein phosphatase
MKYKLRVYSIWEFGNRTDAEGNPHQEDCTYPLPQQLNDSDRTFILCDGMGGHDAGEVASATVCQAMGDYIRNNGHDTNGIFTDDDFKRALDAAFSALDKKDNGAEKKMGTTMTFLKLHNNGATVAHMGDSRVYHIRPGKDGSSTTLWVTEDHSLVNDLIKIGEITKEEARNSRQKNVITRAMQPNMDRKPKADIKHITDIQAGDFFYMCSDGMLEQEDMENGESIKNIFSDAIKSDEDKVSILTEVTKGNRDNHTALIIHILDVTDKIENAEIESTSIPDISVGQAEVDSTEDQKSQDCMASLENTTNDSEISPKEKIQNESMRQSENNIAKAKEDGSNKAELSQGVSAISNHKKTSKRGHDWFHTKHNMPKLVLRAIILVIIVAFCSIVVNYIPACSEESAVKNENVDKGCVQTVKSSKKGHTGPKTPVQSRAGLQKKVKPEETAIAEADSVIVPNVAIDITQFHNGSTSTEATTSLPQLCPTESIVHSDTQTILNKVNTKT